MNAKRILNGDKERGMNILAFTPGTRARVLQTFRDFDGRVISAGTILELASYDHFAHDGGHTLRFVDGTVIRLMDGDARSEPLLSDRDGTYFERQI